MHRVAQDGRRTCITVKHLHVTPLHIHTTTHSHELHFTPNVGDNYTSHPISVLHTTCYYDVTHTRAMSVTPVECLVRGKGSIHRSQKVIQGDDCRPRWRSRPRSPLLNPIRRSSESRGLCCHSCFRPRTCVRGRTNIPKHFGALNQGFPFSLLQCRQERTRWGGGGGSLRECACCLQ